MQLRTFTAGGESQKTDESAVLLTVNLGNAQGALVSPGPVCKAGTTASPDQLRVNLSSGLATVHLDVPLHVDGNNVGIPNVAGLDVPTKVHVTFDLLSTADLSQVNTVTPVDLTVPSNDTVAKRVGSASPLGPVSVAISVTNLAADVAGSAVLPAVLSLVRTEVNSTVVPAAKAEIEDVVNPLSTSINNLLSPLRSLLGLTVGGADVYAVGRPQCSIPALRG